MYLVQRGLRDGVVLDPERVLVLAEDGEDVGERGERGRQLVLQHVAVLLLQRAAAQLALDELHDGQQVRVGARHPQDDGVPVSKPGAEKTPGQRIRCDQTQAGGRPLLGRG